MRWRGFSRRLRAAGILGHVSEKPARAWDNWRVKRAALSGSTLVYDYPWLARHTSLFGLLCLADGLLGGLFRWFDAAHDLLMVMTKDIGA